MENLNKRNRMLDIEKCIACILVIFAHRAFPGTFGGLIKVFSRPSVALFFIISGYFVYNKNEKKILSNSGKRVKKIIKLLIISLSFYFVWESALRLVGSGWESMFLWWKDYVFTFSPWYAAFFWDVDPLAGHLWFLFALVRCYFLFAFIYKINKEIIRFIPVINSIIIFIFQYSLPMRYYRNGWIYGMLFFALGYQIAKHKEKLAKSLSKKSLIIILCMGSILSIIEYFLVGEQQIYLGTLVVSCSAFYLSFYCEVPKLKMFDVMEKIGLEYSLYVYIFHWSVMEITRKFDKELSFSSELWYSYLMPILIAVISIFGSVLLCYITSNLKKISKAN